MLHFGLSSGALLLLAACAQDSSKSSESGGVVALRGRLKQLVESGDRAGTVAVATELLEAGESQPEMLVRLAQIFEGARRPEALIATLERLLQKHALSIPDPDLEVRLWLGYGRACGLSGQLGAYLAPWSLVRSGPAAAISAADRGLVALLENGRAAGRSEELRAEMEEAMRRAPEFADLLRSRLPLLGVDRASAIAARGSQGPEAALDAVVLAAADQRYEDARASLAKELAAIPAEAPERRAITSLQLDLDIASGAPLDAWLSQELAPRQGIELRSTLGRYDEALALLEKTQPGSGIDLAQRHHLHLKILREAGRGNDALTAIDQLLAQASGEAGPLRMVRARVLLELGRLEEALTVLNEIEAAPPPGLNPIALRQTLALVHLLAGRTDSARAAIDAARRIYPVNQGEVEENWGPAVFLAAPESELAGIAFAWTRFPRLRDNDRHFYIAMRALLDGDRAKAQSELEACIACSVGGEYPRRLAEAALRSPALKP
ncbi:MAG: hypothetical protein JNM84_08905 [Planctomycetes bacterium]|nr:hypothetical protein [Planctomycetota bacterium]